MDSADRDAYFMTEALACARDAYANQEVPVGAVVVWQDTIIGRGSNQPRSAHDPTAHAEMIALREAANAVANYRLVDTTLYVTVEPCMMCTGAIVHARIKRLVIGTTEPKAGAVLSHNLLGQEWLNHQVEVTDGVCADTCRALMQEFFAQRRALKAEQDDQLT